MDVQSCLISLDSGPLVPTRDPHYSISYGWADIAKKLHYRDWAATYPSHRPGLLAVIGTRAATCRDQGGDLPGPGRRLGKFAARAGGDSENSPPGRAATWISCRPDRNLPIGPDRVTRQFADRPVSRGHPEGTPWAPLGGHPG